MTDKILITYSTRTGSTISVSEAIGKTLSESGKIVDVIPMHEIKDITSSRQYSGREMAA
jgi:menaquinone-dependent protoporphyrinogen IX oxidase